MNQRDQIDITGVKCKKCQGTGVITCFSCSGRGILIKTTYGFPTSSFSCSHCNGTGVKRICEMCRGEGYHSKTPVQIKETEL